MPQVRGTAAARTGQPRGAGDSDPTREKRRDNALVEVLLRGSGVLILDSSLPGLHGLEKRRHKSSISAGSVTARATQPTALREGEIGKFNVAIVSVRVRHVPALPQYRPRARRMRGSTVESEVAESGAAVNIRILLLLWRRRRRRRRDGNGIFDRDHAPVRDRSPIAFRQRSDLGYQLLADPHRDSRARTLGLLHA